ncbi:MAG: divergent polysaccharide deacetylase family protein [Rhizobiaceae bacterium]
MSDDLTRPLGLKPDGKKAKPSRRGLLVPGLAFFFAFAGASAAIYWTSFDRASREAEPPRTVTELVPSPVKPEEQPGKPQEPASSGNAEQGEQSQPLVSPQASGTLEEKIPVPTFRRQEPGLAHMPDPDLIERGASGVIPKRGSDGIRPMDVYSRPPATAGNFGVARIVIIVGGVGISQTSSQQAIRKLPGAVTLAFAPYGNSLGRWMQEARKQGHEILLQVPMEPFDYPGNNPGPHTLTTAATGEENLANLHWAMSRITNYVGVMNFLGGKFVTTPDALSPVLSELAERGLLFLDDGSTNNSMTMEAASAALLPYARASLQIDAIRTRREIAAQLDKLVQQAKRTGLAIGVANAFSDTIEMLAEFAARADSLGLEITPVSAIVSDPQRKG